MNYKTKLKTLAAIAMVAIFAVAINKPGIFLPNQVTLAEIKPELNLAVNNCFEEVRRSTNNELVYLQPNDSEMNLLVNKYDGYEVIVPCDWKLDNGNFQYVTNLYKYDFKLSIFKEEIDPSYDSTQTYIRYSSYHIRQNYGNIVFLKDDVSSIGPYTTQTISWKRAIISTVEDDLNFYYQSNIVIDNTTVLTFQLKSNSRMIENYTEMGDKVISSLVLIDETHRQNYPQILNEIPDILYKGKTLSLKIPNDKCLFGIYHAPHNDYSRELAELEGKLDFKFELIMEYYGFNIPFKEAEENMLAFYKDKRIMMITLQPFVTITAKEYNGSCLIPEIANGDYDQFLFEWASGLKQMEEPVFLRFANEMNGDWAEWCSWFYSLDPDLFIMAWSRIYTLFEEVGADNVYFVWNPHDRTYPDYYWNKEYLYYPGNSKVDWVGLTAYNNGETRPTEKWREFEECYSQLYLDYMRRYYMKPFIITEFACNEVGGDKAEWITQGFPLLRSGYPNIRIAVWWNGVDGTWLYDIDSTEESEEAFRRALENSYFQLQAVG